MERHGIWFSNLCGNPGKSLHCRQYEIEGRMHIINNYPYLCTSFSIVKCYIVFHIICIFTVKKSHWKQNFYVMFACMDQYDNLES